MDQSILKHIYMYPWDSKKFAGWIITYESTELNVQAGIYKSLLQKKKQQENENPWIM